jgi:prepilin-type N-terminal cleavage/methylation domain-containing protein
MRRRHSTDRPGFTMIELLVVMSIIAVLASLVTASLFKALAAGKTLEERDDIRMLHEGIAAFKAHFGAVPPSYVQFGSTETNSFLKSMYPNIGFNPQGVTWDDGGGSGSLQGNEALVFFLGGPVRGGKPVGWSVNPVDPTDGTVERKIFANFRADRLRRSQNGNFEYLTPLMTNAYAYFSPRWQGKSFGYQEGDCSGLKVRPYGGSTSVGYANRDTYQIIGPGADSIYGTMGPFWTPQEPHPAGEAGADNLSNFHGAVLGSRQ